MVNSIQYLRGIAALFVVLFHIKWMLNNVYANKNLGDILFISGNFGVDLFFVISGFVICLSTEKKENQPCKKFMIRRFFRIYPLLLLSVFFVYILSDSSFSDFIRSTIPIHLDYSKESPVFGYNILVSAWTITYEIVFYFVFLFALNISHKFRCELTVFFLIAINVIANYYYFGEYSVDLGRRVSSVKPDSFLVIFSSSMLLVFIYGIVLYKLYFLFKTNKFIQKTSPYHKHTLYLILLIIIVFMFIKLPEFDGHGVFRWGILSFFIISILLLIETLYGFKKSRFLFWLGDISYSLYITHIVTLEFIFKKLTPYIWNNPNLGFSKLFFYLFISLFFSHFIYIFVEMPFIKYGKSIVQKLNINREP